MPRRPLEWIGKTADTKIPDWVKLRILEREGWRCHISGREIRPGDAFDFDHKIALVNWTGEGHGNCESNIFPALRDKHREKTREDVAIKAATYATRKHHLLPSEPSRIKSAGFPKASPQRKASTAITPKFEGDILARKAQT